MYVFSNQAGVETSIAAKGKLIIHRSFTYFSP